MKAASIIVTLIEWFFTGPRIKIVKNDEFLARRINAAWYSGQQWEDQCPKQPSITMIRRVLLLAERLQ